MSARVEAILFRLFRRGLALLYHESLDKTKRKWINLSTLKLLDRTMRNVTYF
jgi:hypothetical protein